MFIVQSSSLNPLFNEKVEKLTPCSYSSQDIPPFFGLSSRKFSANFGSEFLSHFFLIFPPTDPRYFMPCNPKPISHFEWPNHDMSDMIVLQHLSYNPYLFDSHHGNRASHRLLWCVRIRTTRTRCRS